MILALIHWVVLGGLVVWLLWQRHPTRLEAGLHVLATALAVGFFTLCGEWHAVGGRFLRYPVWLALAFATWRALSRPLVPGRRLRVVRAAALAAFATLFGLGVVTALRARTAADAFDLEFPLRDGTFFVTDGGASRLVNVHYRGGTSQDFGVDLSRLDRWGRQRRLGSRALDAYPVFGTAVLSPCAGDVAEARDGIEDLVPPAYDASKGRGNFVAIDCQGVRVYLLHLEQGSVRAAVGDRVAAGQELGAVGNSGFTLAPHLHIHAARDVDGSGKPTEPVPVTFDGRFLVRNTFVRN